MKRISIVIALTLLAPIVSQARSFGSQRQHIRYSPYAFSYHNSGLVPGGVKYSPYAFTPRHSGLVYQGARYTPYAFNYHNSGLVVDYYWWQTAVCAPCQYQATTRCVAPAKRSTSKRMAARRRPALPSAQLREIRASDGMHVIRQYLKDRGLDGAEISHRLSVESRTAAVAFVFREKNIIVRYRNPEIVETLTTGSEAKRRAYERHEARWETLARTFQAEGGSIYCVDTTGKEQIVAALDNCGALAPSGATLYAKD